MADLPQKTDSQVIAAPPPASMDFGDDVLLKLARELAMDMRELPAVLDLMEMTAEDFEQVKASPVFQRYLRSAVEEWNSATNTSERVKLKSLAMVEESLPEFYARMHDPKETLANKTEVLKTISRFAGVGGQVSTGASAERMVVTINLGADRQLRVEKDITPTYEEDEL